MLCLERIEFLTSLAAGAGIALPIAAGAAGWPVRAVTQTNYDINNPSLMRQLGYAKIDDNLSHLTYHANGSIEKTRPLVARSVGPRGDAPCYDNCAPWETTITFDVGDAGGIVTDQYSGSGTLLDNGFSNDVGAPFFSFFPTPQSSTYWLAAQKAAIRCLDQEAAAVLHAYGMAKYIAANAGSFAVNVGKSATAALKSWGPTGLGVAAAAEFMAGVIGSITVGQWLLISAAIAMSAVLLTRYGDATREDRRCFSYFCCS